MSTKVKRCTIDSLIQDNVDLMLLNARLYKKIQQLEAEKELLIDLIKIEEI